MLASGSLRDLLLSLQPAQRQELIQSLTEQEAEALLFDWEHLWARPTQLEPAGDWLYWVILAGRGFGKTRSGAEWCRKQILEMPGSRGFIAARTKDDARFTCVEGESGLLACLPPGISYTWTPSKGEARFGVGDGVRVKVFSSDKPDSGRGPQHHWGWADELAAWAKHGELWTQLKFGLRLPYAGKDARAVITTTPKPVKVVRDLLKHKRAAVTRGTTYDNLSNLSSVYRAIIAEYEGTRLGRQELNAELLEDTPGALWTRALLDSLRVEMPPLRLNSKGEEELDLVRIVVAVDPATTSGEDADETGIIVVGKGANGHRYVLEDGSLRDKPEKWARTAVDLYHHWQADRIIAEVNQGGEMVEACIKAVDASVPVRMVNASRGKRTRAEPIATAYERNEWHHVGAFELLEDQMCTWTDDSDESPDRMDALVWAGTDLERAAVIFR